MKIQDFIGFSFNKQHSSDFNIIRTSDGSRYNTNLTPNLTDKTADVPGGDGQYYFTSFHKNRTFNINFAFDALSEIDIRKLRKWLSGKEVGDLIFDEEPYKAYSAKVTGAPTLKALCFDDEYGRVYKGEGSITFTCYYPYAHTPDWVWNSEGGVKEVDEGKPVDGRNIAQYEDTIYTNKEEWAGVFEMEGSNINTNRGDLPAPFVYENGSGASAEIRIWNDEGIEEDPLGITFDNPDELTWTWDSRTGIVKAGNTVLKITSGNPCVTIPVGYSVTNDDPVPHPNIKFKYWYY